jgi:hypothetical protein
MPRGKPKQQNGPNKMEAMRQTLAELGNDAKPEEIKGHLKEKFGLDMPNSLISNYKSNLTRKAAGQSALIRKPQQRRMTVPASGNGGRADGINVDDIQTVKALINRIGADNTRALVDVLSQ